MFTDRHDRRDRLIAFFLTAIALAGVHWLRGRPADRPALTLQAAEAAQNTTVFKLTQPLPQARDGVREVMTGVNECRDAGGRKVFSDRPCASVRESGLGIGPEKRDWQQGKALDSPVAFSSPDNLDTRRSGSL